MLFISVKKAKTTTKNTDLMGLTLQKTVLIDRLLFGQL
jgi:hypothetical protein